MSCQATVLTLTLGFVCLLAVESPLHEMSLAEMNLPHFDPNILGPLRMVDVALLESPTWASTIQSLVPFPDVFGRGSGPEIIPRISRPLKNHL